MNKLLLLEVARSGVILSITYIAGRVVTTIARFLLNKVRAPRMAHLIVTNTIWFLIGWIALLTILSVLNLKAAFNLSALGLAISAFLVQGIATSIIQGLIIVIEHDFDVGDYISVAGMSGTVTDIGLRLTFLITDTGQKITVPNSMIYSSGIINGRVPAVETEQAIDTVTAQVTRKNHPVIESVTTSDTTRIIKIPWIKTIIRRRI